MLFNASADNFNGDHDDKSSTNIIYNATHAVEVVRNGLNQAKTLIFILAEMDNALKMKIRDTCDYCFNYTAIIDWKVFSKMKSDQHLDITFDEFKPQIIELFHLANRKQMLIRLELDGVKCSLVFYEKSRIKSLVFLIIELNATNYAELMEEMVQQIAFLKESNKTLQYQLNLTKSQLRNSEDESKSMSVKNQQLHHHFQQALELVLDTFMAQISKIEAKLVGEFVKLMRRHDKIAKDVDVVKSENLLKGESSARLVRSLQQLRVENDRNASIVHELRAQVETLTSERTRAQKNVEELQQMLRGNERQLENREREMAVLKKDIEEATIIIAQKTKANDELGRDLVQANQMLVNFNNQYDTMLKKVSDLQEELHQRDRTIACKDNDIEKLHFQFEQYQKQYNTEEHQDLMKEIDRMRDRIQQLEKENHHVMTLNNLLTQKLSPADFMQRPRIPTFGSHQ